ncbi:hypothetical protein PoB_000237600 [Plakobranchus ocellatus]|uniref:Uncharacterized protein n=1 Tax=Plakobranchus ocellatus TaxID=259542 RepID=A0AAV3XYH0_9GAST|nr:hypothetical protein PoB_000237600 [Plakobranchus ocellatus]
MRSPCLMVPILLKLLVNARVPSQSDVTAMPPRNIMFCLLATTVPADRPTYYDSYYPAPPRFYRETPGKVIHVHHYTEDGVGRYYHGDYPSRSYDYDYGYDYNQRSGRSGKSQLIELLLLSSLLGRGNNGGNTQGQFLPNQGGVLPGGSLIG